MANALGWNGMERARVKKKPHLLTTADLSVVIRASTGEIVSDAGAVLMLFDDTGGGSSTSSSGVAKFIRPVGGQPDESLGR